MKRLNLADQNSDTNYDRQANMKNLLLDLPSSARNCVDAPVWFRGAKNSVFGVTKNACKLGNRSLTFLYIPWSRVLLEKLTGFQLVKKFSAFHGKRRLITAGTSARQLSLS
jgi:hypothetical protein